MDDRWWSLITGYSYLSVHSINYLAWYQQYYCGLSMWRPQRTAKCFLFTLGTLIHTHVGSLLQPHITQYLENKEYNPFAVALTALYLREFTRVTTIFNMNLQMIHTQNSDTHKKLPCLWMLYQQLRHMLCNPTCTALGFVRQWTITSTKNKSQHASYKQKPRMYHQAKISYHRIGPDYDLPNTQIATSAGRIKMDHVCVCVWGQLFLRRTMTIWPQIMRKISVNCLTNNSTYWF